MPSSKKIEKDKSLDNLLNQSEEITNYSRNIQMRGALLSRRLVMLHRQSDALIDYSRKIIKNHGSIHEMPFDEEKIKI